MKRFVHTLSKRSFCTPPSSVRSNYLGRTADSLVESFRELGLKDTVAPRVWNHVYHKGVRSFDEIPESEIGRNAKQVLSDHYSIDHGTICKESTSNMDGTAKWLLGYGEHKVETVYIPSDLCREDDVDFPARRKSGTICVSSQVGCTVGCSFCFTGTQKIARNLLPGEIVGQVMTALKQLNEFSIDRNIQSIVFMGQGEPFYNYSNVVKAIHTLVDQNGLCFSKKKITISTSGVVPKIRSFTEDPELDTVQLAISLHAVHDSVRDKLIPLNKQWNLNELMQACRDYHQKRRILFEYVMLKDINDSEADAYKLVEMLKGIRALVNLIPFNSWPGAPYETSTKEKIMKFHEIVQQGGITAPIRWPRGDDILAACGQLQTVQDKLVKEKSNDNIKLMMENIQ